MKKLIKTKKFKNISLILIEELIFLLNNEAKIPVKPIKKFINIVPVGKKGKKEPMKINMPMYRVMVVLLIIKIFIISS